MKNLINGTNGNDSISGTAVGDRIFGFHGNDSLFGSEGKDDLHGSLGDDHVSGDKGNDIVDGGAGNDYVVGGLGSDALYGRSGSDTLVAGAGDYLNGGLGEADTIILDSSLDQVGTIHGVYEDLDTLDLSNLVDPNVTFDGNDLLVFDNATGTALRFVDGLDIGTILYSGDAIVPEAFDAGSIHMTQPVAIPDQLLL